MGQYQRFSQKAIHFSDIATFSMFSDSPHTMAFHCSMCLHCVFSQLQQIFREKCLVKCNQIAMQHRHAVISCVFISWEKWIFMYFKKVHNCILIVFCIFLVLYQRAQCISWIGMYPLWFLVLRNTLRKWFIIFDAVINKIYEIELNSAFHEYVCVPDSKTNFMLQTSLTDWNSLTQKGEEGHFQDL